MSDLTMICFPSRIKIFPYHKGDSPTLERKLSLFDYRTHELTITAYLISVRDECIYVPRGFGITEIQKLLESDNYYDTRIICDNFYPPNNTIDIRFKPGIGAKDEHQIDSVSFLVKDFPDSDQKFLNIDTGFGKTFCSIKASSLLGYRTMVVIDKSGLMNQWISKIKEYTYCKDDDICIIQGRDSLESAIINGENKIRYKYYICATQTLAIAGEEDRLNEFIKSNDIGLKIIDEAHEMMKANTIIDLSCDVKYNFYLTATPQRSDSLEDLLYSKITKTFKRFGAYTVNLLKYTYVKNVFINTFPSPFHQRISKTRNGFSSIIYEKWVFKSDRKVVFVYLICRYIAMELLSRDPDAKILFVFSINDNIKKISDLFYKNDRISCGIYTNENMKLKAKALDKNIILSNIKNCGAGMDIANLRAVVNFVPFKSPVLLHQLFGRLRYIDGKALFYFNVIDEGYKDIVKQNFYRQKFFKTKSKNITNIRLNMNDLVDKFYREKE